MKKNKITFFIVPGFKMQAEDKAFFGLVDFLESKKVKVVKAPVDWNYKTLSQNTEEFIKFFNQNKSGKNYVLGFSYGAVITFLSANTLKPNKIFLCSLSPDFKEDQKYVDDKSKRYRGIKRFNDIKTRSGKELAKNLKVPAVVFYGEKEAKKYPELKKRCQETVKLSKNSKLIIVKNAPHKIDFPEYMTAIKKELMNIVY